MAKNLDAAFVSAVMTAMVGLSAFATPETAIDSWKHIVSQGELYETKHNYGQAVQAFSAAVSLSEAQKLPGKYLATALCRKTGNEIRQNLISRANSDCDRLMNLVNVQKANHTLDPDTEVWVLDLANAYQAHEAPDTRESCLLKLCEINKVLYGENNKEYRNARTLLGRYYEHGQLVKGAQIQSVAEADLAKQAELNSSDPAARSNNLYQLALHYKISGKLEEAKTAELQLLEIAKTNPGVADGIPAYYACLGSISLAQDKELESRDYFAKAIKAGSKFKGNNRREVAVDALLSKLVDSVRIDKNPKTLDRASKELKQLLSLQRSISAVPEAQYGILRSLAEALNSEHKPDEACEYLKQAIALAARPKSSVAQDIPELWMHVALIRNSQLRTADANEAFNRALKAETDKGGFHATKVLVFWGGLALQANNVSLASEKLSIAARQAGALPIAKRGTLLIDPLYGLCMINIREKNLKANQEHMSKLIPEIKEQMALNSNLGPNFWNKLQRDRFIW
jgi:hypothetical protein